MSWINSNATYKQNSKNDLSFYHGFSKTPVEPTSTGTAATTLANASTKGGHTVIGTEVWAEEIPWFGLVASRAAAVTRLSGLTKLNDLVKVDGEGGKVYKYKGADDAVFTEDNWADFWAEVTLTNGMVLNNRHNQPVLRYYLNQPMQTLTTTNNASIDSKGFATRLFVNEETHAGQTSGGSVVSQFAAGTDNIKNGIPSVELNPKLYLGTTEKIAGTHYYDYNVSGTILWSTAVTSSSPKISCFRYIGKTVTSQLATIDSTVTAHSNEISEIKDKLGLGETETPGTPTLGGRVTDNETALRVLLGLEGDAKVVATESISTTATTAASNAVSTGLAAGGSIATAIEAAKQEAISSAEVTINAGTGISIEGGGTGTTFEISVDETVATAQSVTDLTARVKANEDAISTLTTGDSSVAKQIETALTTAKDYTNTEVGKVAARLTGKGDVAKAIEAAAAKGQQGITDAAAAKSAADAAQAAANAAQGTADAAKATADTAVQTVTGDTYVKATKSSTTVTLATDIEAIDTALAAEGTTLATAIAAAKKAGEDAGSTALAAAQTAQTAAEAAQAAAEAAQTTANQGVADAATAQGAAEAAQATAEQAVEDAAAAKKAGEDAAAGALSAAQTAQAAAQTAQAAAEAAQSTADTAQAAAEAADAKAAKAATDAASALATAKTELEGKITAAQTAAEKTASDALASAKTELEGKITAAQNAATTAGQNAANAAQTAAEATAKAYTDTEVKKVSDALATAISEHDEDIKTVEAAIEGITTSGFSRVIVETLPTEDIKLNAIYLVKNTESEAGEYIEYIYVQTLGKFEQIGSTKTDLSEYAKTADVTSAIATAKSEAIADAEGKVNTLAATHDADKAALETSISTLTTIVTDNKTTTDEAIAALAAAGTGRVSVLESQVAALTSGDTSVAKQIETAINGLGTGETQGGAGVTLTQTKGVATLTVVSGAVAAKGEAGADKFVKGETVYAETSKISAATAAAQKDATQALADAATAQAAAEAADDKAVAAQGTADTAVANAKTADDKAVAAQGTADTALANAATADGKAVAAQGTADQAVADAAAAQSTANAKIAAVEVATDAATHIGAEHISVATDADKKVTITVNRSAAWNASEVTVPVAAVEVINGEMFNSDGDLIGTIDDANLVNGTSMFAGEGKLNLKKYVGDLGKLTTGTNMFNGCANLTTFCGNLGSLTEGTGMFAGCKLDEESLIYIVDSLPVVTSGTITVGVAAGVDKAPYVTEADKKGWTLA